MYVEHTSDVHKQTAELREIVAMLRGLAETASYNKIDEPYADLAKRCRRCLSEAIKRDVFVAPRWFELCMIATDEDEDVKVLAGVSSWLREHERELKEEGLLKSNTSWALNSPYKEVRCVAPFIADLIEAQIGRLGTKRQKPARSDEVMEKKRTQLIFDLLKQRLDKVVPYLDLLKEIKPGDIAEAVSSEAIKEAPWDVKAAIMEARKTIKEANLPYIIDNRESWGYIMTRV